MTRLLLALLLLSVHAHGAMMNGGWDWETKLWRVRCATNAGGTVSDASYRNATDFMQSIKRWGVRSQVASCGLYLGDNTNCITLGIINDIVNTDGNMQLIAFAAADYSEAIGLTGNGTTKYISLATPAGGTVTMSQIGQFAHLGVYCRSNVSNAAQHWIGATTSVGDSSAYVLGNFSGLTYGQVNDAVAQQWNSADTNAVGFYIGTRTATNFAAIYKNGAQLSSQTANVTGAHTSVGTIFVHALNVDGTQTALTARTLSFWTVGFALTPTTQLNYYLAVQKLQQRTGRAIFP